MDFRVEGGESRPRRVSSGLSTAELFLGIKQSATEPIVSNGVELDENDVVWAGDYEETTTETRVITGFSAISLSNGNESSNTARRRMGIEHTTAGLSAAMVDDRRALGRSSLSRKSLANFNVAAVRMIPSVALNSRSSSEEYSSSARKYHQSAPVKVPLWSKSNHRVTKPQNPVQSAAAATVDEEDDEKDEERLPPHEILARDYARTHTTTFSVCEGLGRTLKGRDLSRVRNAVWRQTDENDIIWARPECFQGYKAQVRRNKG